MTAETSNARDWVLERLRGVLEHGKMGDKCMIAPDLVTAAIAALSASQPAAVSQERPEKPAECADGCPPQQVCGDHCQWPPGPDSEAQAQGGGEVAGWVLEDTFVNAKFWTADTPPQGWTPVYYTAPPSAPVGVELAALRVQEWLQDEYDILPPVQEIERAMRTPCSCAHTESALAQQPAAADGVKCPWDEGSSCVDPRPAGMVYPTKPAPRASGYLDSSGVEWNAWDAGQMEAYARAAYSDGWEAGYREALAAQQQGDK